MVGGEAGLGQVMGRFGVGGGRPSGWVSVVTLMVFVVEMGVCGFGHLSGV